MKYRNSVPVIATADVSATLSYYASVLGFRELFSYGSPLVYAGMQRDGAQLYISQDVELADLVVQKDLHPEIFLWVDEVDAWYAQHQRNGAKIVEEISDRPWDARQYVVEDPNGYFIKIAQPIDDITEA
ncbi:MAG TPA: VOC family protein [Steroidobacteraceae bacterium]